MEWYGRVLSLFGGLANPQFLAVITTVRRVLNVRYKNSKKSISLFTTFEI